MSTIEQTPRSADPTSAAATEAAVSTGSVESMIDELAARGHRALQAFDSFTQEQITPIVHAMALAGLDQHMKLAKLAVEETGRGLYEDKIVKNIFATEYVWNSIKYDRTVGVIHRRYHPGHQPHLDHDVQVSDRDHDQEPGHLRLPPQCPAVLGSRGGDHAGRGDRRRCPGELHPVDRGPLRRGDRAVDESPEDRPVAGHRRIRHGRGRVLDR
jgi:hypothetical protein